MSKKRNMETLDQFVELWKYRKVAAMTQLAAERAANDEKTARLRALRLERDRGTNAR